MIEAVSCGGGVVIHKGKILLLYKNYKHRYEAGSCQKVQLKKMKSINRQL